MDNNFFPNNPIFSNLKAEPVSYGRLAHLRKNEVSETKSEKGVSNTVISSSKEQETMKSLSTEQQSELMTLDKSTRKALLQRYQARIERSSKQEQKVEESDNSNSSTPSI